MMEYAGFLEQKQQYGEMSGFDPIWLPDELFDFQKTLTDWAIHKGRAALYEECGMGKTFQELVWGENVVRHTNKPVLHLTPLAVGQQTMEEAHKFGIDAVRSSGGTPTKKCVVITNYQKLHHFNPDDFAGVVCDESQCIKDDKSITRGAITEFMRMRPYRLLCSATPAPNDYVELGTSAEALGEMGFQDMITMFFKKEVQGGHHGWARAKYQMRGHAERDFWRWICSWARAIRKPSDIGGDDTRFILPPLETVEHTVESAQLPDGYLFAPSALSLQEQRAERRRTIVERCEKAAELALAHKGSSVLWAHLNDEGDMMREMVKGEQISGKDSDEEKEEKLVAFANGQITKLVSKSSLTGYGLNWQFCDHQTFFPSHSFQEYYQSVRRSWRFGQQKTVRIDMISSDGEQGILKNLQRKQNQADVMFEKLVALMGDQLKITRVDKFTKPPIIPSWI